MPPSDKRLLPEPVVGAARPVANPRGEMVRSGAELVELGERFFGPLFVGCTLFVSFSCLAALALLPIRDSDAGYDTVTVPIVVAIMVAAPFAAARAREFNRLLRTSTTAQVAIVATSAALVAYPLRSELWWPSCALIMLLGTVVGVRRVIVAALAVLLCNFVAHAVAGDLGETPAVSIIGLWVGFGFWSVAFSLLPDQLTAYVMRVNVRRTAAANPAPAAPTRVDARVVADPQPTTTVVPVASRADTNAVRALTARQLQVVALLADGCRYDEIAACLAISERQVQRHVSVAVARFGVRNANELVARAVLAGLVPSAA